VDLDRDSLGVSMGWRILEHRHRIGNRTGDWDWDLDCVGMGCAGSVVWDTERLRTRAC
jgi:hypothetical protein